MQNNEIQKCSLINKIIKYPYCGKNKNLFDKFLIIGYDYPTLQRVISSKIINTELNQYIFLKNSKKLINYEPLYNLFYFIIEEEPIVLNDISNNYSKTLYDNEQIIKKIFPKKPKCYIYKSDLIKKDNRYKTPKSYCVIFNNNQNDNLNQYSIGFIFYHKFEKEIEKCNYFYLIPVCYCFISDYPFFTSYYFVASQFKNLLNKEINIPLELIIYNMILFTPAPINNMVTLNIIPYIQLNDNDNGNNYKINVSNLFEIKFNIVSGYPLIQFNLLKVLFSTFSSQSIIEIFIMSFLQKNIIFFSENIEHLTLLMYSIIHLNYPFNEYYCINIIGSFQELIEKISLISDKNINIYLGINESYDNEYDKKMKNLKEYIIFDIDKGKIFYSNRNDIVKKLIRKICKDGSITFKKETNHLYNAIKRLYNKLEKNIIQFNLDNKFNFFEYNDNIKNKNNEIQEEFYIFIMIISLYIYNNINFTKINELKYEFNEQLIDNNYTEEEKYFINQIKETVKFDLMIQGFIPSLNSLNLNQISLSFIKEFIFLFDKKYNQKIEYENTLKHLNIINMFYNINSNKDIIHINFNMIYNYFYQEMKKKYLRNISEYKYWIIKKNGIKDENGLIDVSTVNYNYIQLNNELILEYSHYLNELNQEEISKLFPFNEYINKNEFETIEINKIENLIEEQLIESNFITKNDILASSIIMIFALSFQIINLNEINIFNFIIVDNLFKSKFFILRKYYTILFDILFRLLNDEESKKNFYKQMQLINCYRPLFNKILENNIIPNGKLLIEIKQIDDCIDKLGLSNYEDKSDISSNLNEQINNEYYTNELYKFLIDDKNINIGDNINIKLIKQKSKIECHLMNIITVYNILSKIVEDYLHDLNSEKLDNSLITECIINTLYYIEREKYFEEEKPQLIHLLYSILIQYNK